MRGIKRLELLLAGGAAAVLVTGGCSSTARGPNGEQFLHGVASGDPLQTRVMIWTRLSGATDGQSVEWLVARDRGLSDVVRSGTVIASAAQDFCCKVDVAQLEAASSYFYAFRLGALQSAVGQTRTLAASGLAATRFAVVSCSHYQQGRYAAYARIAETADLAAVLHLGDYIYEYGDVSGGTIAMDPPHEIVSLEDYRRRYAFYRRDPSLQACHRAHPFIVVWDDHESANNSWSGGAQNHSPQTEGEWSVRRAAAIRAWHEWMPVRDSGTSEGIHRGFRVGDLADLMMLDTRIEGRERAANSARKIGEKPGRELLGDAQEHWLKHQLQHSQSRGARWRLIGQQVIFTPLGDFNPDQWDGYPQARQRIMDFIRTVKIDNVVMLTGDIHSSWALDVAPEPYSSERYDRASGAGSIAVEFVTPGISSEPLGPYLRRNRDKRLAKVEEGIRKQPHLRFVDLENRGFMLLDMNAERVEASWYFVSEPDNVRSRVPLAHTERVLHGANHLARDN